MHVKHLRRRLQKRHGDPVVLHLVTRVAAVVCALVAFVLPALPAGAASLAKPTGEIVLTVKGNIAHTNGDGVANFDMAMLEALAGRKAIVETPWTKGKVNFEGPLGKALLDMVGGQGKNLRVRALNDYAVDIPLKDFVEHEVILATRRDGASMSVREHGPLFIVYPFDLEPALYNEKYFSRCVWQVASITVE
jgi:hypothetical protein